MERPRLLVLALGGTIAMVKGDAGGVKPGLGADELAAAVPALGEVVEVRGETVAKVASPSLTFEQIYALAARIQRDADAKAIDACVITQGTDTIEETAFLLDCLLEVAIPVIVIGAMRNPLMTSPDGAGNLLAAARVAAAPWVRASATELGVMVVMLDHAYSAFDVVKAHSARIDAFDSPQSGPLATLIEDRVLALARPLRAWKQRVRELVGASPAARLGQGGSPVALIALGLGEQGALIDAILAAPDRLGYRGAVIALMGGGHAPSWVVEKLGRLAAAMPTIGAGRMGGGPLLRKTYEFPGAEIDLGRRGLIPAGRLGPYKARVLLELLLRADCDANKVRAAFTACE